MSLEANITPQRVANSIMLRSTTLKSFIIVEGKTDSLLFNKFINKESCGIEIAFGKEKVVEVINELRSRDFFRVLGIIDSDFGFLDNDLIEDESIFSTDYHDIEIMFIKSGCFETVLSNYIQEEKLQKKYGDYSGFRDHLFEVTKHLGYLKWLNKFKSIGLIFKPPTPEGKSIEYSNFISVNDLNFLGYEKLVDTILNYCNGKVKISIKREELIKELTEFIKECDLDHLCNGHDLIHIISLSLKKNISNLNARSVSPEQLSRDFSLSYEARYFCTSQLYENIKEWEANKGLIVLNC